MEKILVEIIAPATSARYDFSISKKFRIREAMQKLIEEISQYEKAEALFPDSENIFLYEAKTEKVLNRNDTFEEAGVKSGDVLMII